LFGFLGIQEPCRTVLPASLPTANKPAKEPVAPHGTPPVIGDGSVILLGLDVHLRQITVVRQIDHSLPQPAQRFDQPGLLDWVGKMIARGATVHSCYEAGCFGYVLHRALTQLGANNLVVAPEVLNPRKKTDARDARELCIRLERHLAGNTHALAVVRIPTLTQERQREAGRQRERLLRERLRAERRGASLMLLEGHKACRAWWKPALWSAARIKLPADLAIRIDFWQQQALYHDQEEKRLSKALENETTIGMRSLPAGLGKLTWRLLCGEILTWSRFQNRRQVASYTGLCPGEDSSGESHRQGPINRHGNPRIRTLLIETVWRLTRFEPQWRGFGKFPCLLDNKAGGRKRRRAVVAAARLLAIDLWRLETAQTDAAALGFRQPFLPRNEEPEVT
jgi:transposase